MQNTFNIDAVNAQHPDAMMHLAEVLADIIDQTGRRELLIADILPDDEKKFLPPCVGKPLIDGKTLRTLDNGEQMMRNFVDTCHLCPFSVQCAAVGMTQRLINQNSSTVIIPGTQDGNSAIGNAPSIIYGGLYPAVRKKVYNQVISILKQRDLDAQSKE